MSVCEESILIGYQEKRNWVRSRSRWLRLRRQFCRENPACFLLTGHFYPSSSPRLIIDLNVSSPSSGPKIHRSQQDLAPLTSTPLRASSPPPIIDPNILRSTFLSFFQPVLPTFLSNVYFSKYENAGCIYCAYREVLLLV